MKTMMTMKIMIMIMTRKRMVSSFTAFEFSIMSMADKWVLGMYSSALVVI